MPSFNRVILIGRLTRDPEMRTTASGLTVAKFSIAVDRRFKNPQGERVTDFFDCSAFRQKAEFVEQYVTKGRLVAVEGTIELNEAAGQDGVKRRYVNIVVDNVETLDRAGDSEGGGGGGGYAGRDSGGHSADADEEPDERPAPRAAPRAASPDREERPSREAAPARPAARPAAASAGARPARPAAKPAEPTYPSDDFDDSDPFADE